MKIHQEGIQEVRRILVPRKSILDHTRWQSRCQRIRSFLDQNSSNFRNSKWIFIKRQNILTNIWINMKFKSWKSIKNYRSLTYFSLENIEFSGTYFANLLCNLMSSKIDFLWTKIRLTSVILNGFSWLTGILLENILLTGIAILTEIYK